MCCSDAFCQRPFVNGLLSTHSSQTRSGSHEGRDGVGHAGFRLEFGTGTMAYGLQKAATLITPTVREQHPRSYLTSKHTHPLVRQGFELAWYWYTNSRWQGWKGLQLCQLDDRVAVASVSESSVHYCTCYFWIIQIRSVNGVLAPATD